MLEISKQLIGLATATAELMVQSGETFAPIQATGFFVLSKGCDVSGYAPLHLIEVAGHQFLIAWESGR
jgi:hypothetical protein